MYSSPWLTRIAEAQARPVGALSELSICNAHCTMVLSCAQIRSFDLLQEVLRGRVEATSTDGLASLTRNSVANTWSGFFRGVVSKLPRRLRVYITNNAGNPVLGTSATLPFLVHLVANCFFFNSKACLLAPVCSGGLFSDFLTVVVIPCVLWVLCPFCSAIFEAIWFFDCLANQGVRTAEFPKGTSLETLESQTQPDLLYQIEASCAEVHRKRETNAVRQTTAVFDLMACSPAGFYTIGAPADCSG